MDLARPAEPPAVFKGSLQPYLWMLAGSFCFAWMGEATHALRGNCPWPVIAVARSSLPLVCAASLGVLGGARLVLFTPRTLWVRSIAGSVSLVCTFFALTVLPPSHVFTLASTFPLWVALLSWPLYGERPSWPVGASVAASVAGVVLLGWTAPAAEADRPPLLRGLAVASTLVAALSTAVAMLGLHRLRHLHPWAIVAHFSGVALLFSAASLFVESPPPASADLPEPRTLLLLFAVGATATVGQLFLTKAFSAGPPTKIAVVNLTQVVFAGLLDGLLWGRAFNRWTLAGMALILAPTAWLMSRRASPATEET